MTSNWLNFRIWRGRLPHWRADDVRYYATFRHRRELDEAERRVLLKELIKGDGKRWDLAIACVLPTQTELIFTVRGDHELSGIVEGAKRKAGNLITKNTGERFPPFYNESYDRIIRDEAELEERLNDIFNSPMKAELADAAEQYEGLWMCGGHSE